MQLREELLGGREGLGARVPELGVGTQLLRGEAEGEEDARGVLRRGAEGGLEEVAGGEHVEEDEDGDDWDGRGLGEQGERERRDRSVDGAGASPGV